MTQNSEKAAKRRGLGRPLRPGQLGIADRNVGSTEGKLVGGVTGKGWLPGQSGNPGGRRPLPDLLRERLDALVPEAVEGILKLGRTAESETVRLGAWEYLVNRRFGRPTEKVQQEVSHSPAVMPSDEQLEQLARRALGQPEGGADD